MRIVIPLALLTLGFATLSGLALARGSKPTPSCSPVVALAPEPDNCTVSQRLCENWLKGRSAYRAMFKASSKACS